MNTRSYARTESPRARPVADLARSTVKLEVDVASTTAPYGAWPSPITAAALARARRDVGDVAVDGDGRVWWSEGRTAEGGRQCVLRRERDGSLTELLSPGWDARTRVHEYGGAAWRPLPDGGLIYSNGPDHRLYRLDAPQAVPVPLTADTGPVGSVRYADPCPLATGDAVLCVRESYRDSSIERALVRIPLDGSGTVTEVWSGTDFVSTPRVSPDGARLAWLGWNHPDMPWDGTELRLARFDGCDATEVTLAAGGPAESLFAPQWGLDGNLYVVSDRSGWWNLYRVSLDGPTLWPLAPMNEECGVPQWQFGASTFAVLPGVIAFVHGTARQRLSVLDLASCRLRTLDLPYTAWGASLAGAGTLVAGVAAGPADPATLVAIDVRTGTVEPVRHTADALDPDYISVPESVRVPTESGRAIPITIYAPANPRYSGPAWERPPYVVTVHGGPTSQSRAVYRPAVAYLTSRGIGVVEVDYAGSTGYGRAYRELLQGAWGVLDVADCVAVAEWLVASGRAAPGRLSVRGGSSGGFTALACLADADVFAAGVSSYGVADLERLAAETHDFESRYVERLVGMGTDGTPRYRERSPLSRADRIRRPLLLLQGADDRVVPPSQAASLVAALGPDVPYASLLFAGESHGFRKQQTIIRAMEAELSFYGQVLGFEPPDVPVLTLVRGRGFCPDTRRSRSDDGLLTESG